MKNPKNLTKCQKEFLEKQGLNPKDYKIIAAPSEHYKFFNVKKEKEVIIRR